MASNRSNSNTASYKFETCVTEGEQGWLQMTKILDNSEQPKSMEKYPETLFSEVLEIP
ncbi:MAG: hypothetical protein ACC612_07005 [Methanomethylovorans sp.]|uniref:hypothetical protein n=1 Tax=Methanomethylovorans sp. TaxID=2758717 RepID=UPI0035309F2A